MRTGQPVVICTHCISTACSHCAQCFCDEAYETVVQDICLSLQQLNMYA